MRIAIPYDNGQVHGHLGDTEYFKFYEVEGRKVLSSTVVDAPSGGPAALFGFLAESKVDVLLGAMCANAVRMLGELGVEAYGGVSGEADAELDAFLNNSIEFGELAQCEH